jgi:hypothetical protein
MQKIVEKNSRNAFDAAQGELEKMAKKCNDATFKKRTWKKSMAPKVETRFDGVPARYLRNWTLIPEYAQDLVEEHDMNIFKAGLHWNGSCQSWLVNFIETVEKLKLTMLTSSSGHLKVC